MKAFGLLRFAEDPELRHTKDGVAFAEFALVFSEKRKSQDKLIENPHFLDFVIYDKAAEVVCRDFKKGNVIYVESATPRQQKWTTEEGAKRSRVVFRINEFAYVPRNKVNAETTTEPEVQS